MQAQSTAAFDLPVSARVLAEWRPEDATTFQPSRVLVRLPDKRVAVAEVTGAAQTLKSVPVSRGEAREYAEQILCGDSAALTVPGGMMALAAAYYSLCLTLDSLGAKREAAQ